MNQVEANPIVYVDQSPETLVLSLVAGEIDKRSLSVLDTGRVPLPGGHLEFAIIGASHYAQWRDDRTGARLAELFACVRPSESGRQWTADQRPALLNNTVRGITHQMASRTTRGGAAVATHRAFIEEVDSAQESIVLIRQFPGDPDPFKPVTAVIVNPTPSGARVKTLHAYPNVSACVVTRSTFQINDKRFAHV